MKKQQQQKENTKHKTEQTNKAKQNKTKTCHSQAFLGLYTTIYGLKALVFPSTVCIHYVYDEPHEYHYCTVVAEV